MEDWATQLLFGADSNDVLVSDPGMAPFLKEVEPFIKIHFSSYVMPGAVYRMPGKVAELLIQGRFNNENRNPSREG